MGPQITVLIQGSTSQSSSTKDRILAWLEEEDASSGPHQVRIAFKGQSIGAPQDKYNQYLDHLKQEKESPAFIPWNVRKVLVEFFDQCDQLPFLYLKI